MKKVFSATLVCLHLNEIEFEKNENIHRVSIIVFKQVYACYDFDVQGGEN